MTHREKARPKGPDPADPFLELVRRAEELNDEDDDESEEVERLTQKIWAAIRAAIQSGELPGRE
jgi:hypothetical protein